ncbi:unnamed protein product [Ceratitis capitata]|uniref:(Mediterranean fruit fly) hypothetical protein n=1 Tax=Ceratitis capitata TaxID=7213 RepID=A0A811VAL7_CERCA|nr:unnamed protein product [Ceratitis capitata]
MESRHSEASSAPYRNAPVIATFYNLPHEWARQNVLLVVLIKSNNEIHHGKTNAKGGLNEQYAKFEPDAGVEWAADNAELAIAFRRNGMLQLILQQIRSIPPAATHVSA